MKVSKIFSEGFKSDLSTFINLFKNYRNEGQSEFDYFKECWRQMKFDGIFVGRSSIAEFYECCEDYIHITKEYFFSSDSLKTFAIYLLYTIYYKQPASGYAKIRLTAQQWNELKAFWITLDLKHHAKLMISKMYKDGAFKFVMTDREFGLEACYEKLHKNDSSTEDK